MALLGTLGEVIANIPTEENLDQVVLQSQFTVESDGTGAFSQFIIAAPSINTIVGGDSANACAILSGGNSAYPHKIGAGGQLCFIICGYDNQIISGFGSGGSVN